MERHFPTFTSLQQSQSNLNGIHLKVLQLIHTVEKRLNFSLLHGFIDVTRHKKHLTQSIAIIIRMMADDDDGDDDYGKPN